MYELKNLEIKLSEFNESISVWLYIYIYIYVHKWYMIYEIWNMMYQQTGERRGAVSKAQYLWYKNDNRVNE